VESLDDFQDELIKEKGKGKSLRWSDATHLLSLGFCDLSIKDLQNTKMNWLFEPLLDPGYNSHRLLFVTTQV
jgi:hypothetical protein